MQKVLILGGSHRDIPLIEAAQELGYFVITIANKKEYIGHRYADKFYNVDFNDLTLVEQIIQDEQIDHLIPGCGEESYLNTVILSDKLHIGNFDTLQTAKLLHNKWKFKTFCLQHGVSTPKGVRYTQGSFRFSLTFPIIVKPTNLSGGRGVTVVNDNTQLQSAIKQATQESDEILLEEFIQGELIACSVILLEQKIAYAFIGADKSYLNDYLVTTAYPISIDPLIKKKIFKDIETIAKKLHLADGMFHLQIIIQNDTPYIIDVTRRIPGDLYPKLIEYCDGIEYSKAVVETYIGKKITANLTTTKQKSVIRHCVMPKQNGFYESIHIDKSLQKNILYQLNLLPTGTKINNYLRTQIAILFLEVEDDCEMIASKINTLIYPIIKSRKEQ